MYYNALDSGTTGTENNFCKRISEWDTDMVETVFHDLTVNWSHTKHTCFSGPTTNLPHWTYLPIQPKPCSISTATQFYRPSYRDKIIYLTNSLRLWVIKSILKLKSSLLKVQFQLAKMPIFHSCCSFFCGVFHPRNVQTISYYMNSNLFQKKCFAEINILNIVFSWSRNLYDSIMQ